MRAKDLKDAIRLCIKSGQNLCISGAPAIGKTEIVKQVAYDIIKGIEGAEVHMFHPVTDDPSEYKGLGFPSADRSYADFLPYGNLKKLIDAKVLTIVVIDDVGQAPFSVQAALMQLIQEHNINSKKVSEYVRFILCTNRKADKAAVQGLIEPVKSRCILVKMDVNDDDWRQWAAQVGMPPELIAFSKLRPNLLHDFKPTSDMTNSASPRGWAAVGILQNNGITKNLEYEMFAGCNGEQFAAEYTAFLKTYREMPNPQAWIDNPEKELPTNESVCYALASALAYMATKKNVEAIFKVAMRLDAEYSTFLVFSMVQKNKNLAENSGMAVWAKKYAPYLL